MDKLKGEGLYNSDQHYAMIDRVVPSKSTPYWPLPANVTRVVEKVSATDSAASLNIVGDLTLVVHVWEYGSVRLVRRAAQKAPKRRANKQLATRE